MSADLKAINCTACGGTLDILGGHRVKSLVCGYCGSIMDSHAGFEVIERYRDQPDRPEAPIKIGMQAELKGVHFTAIGMIKYASHQFGPGWAESYDWISFQLYSPTHGYSWLTWNLGHYLFSYRTREMPDPPTPDRLSQKNAVRLESRTFKMFERYQAVIEYIEGEFTWIAKRGESVRVVEAIDPPLMFSYERGENELEYSIGEYMDAADVHAAFALDTPSSPTGVHPAQPFKTSRFAAGLSKVGPIFAGIAVVGLLAVFVLGDGREILRIAIDNPSSSSWTVPFEATDTDQLMKIQLRSPVSNNWVYYDMSVTAADSDEPVLWLGQEVSFYEGRDADGYWSEGSRQAEALFKVPKAGDYEIEIEATEAGGSIPPLEIRLYDRVLVKRYVVLLLILSILASLALPITRNNFEKRRWSDVLEDDDD